MKQKLQLISLFTILVLTTACGGGDSSEDLPVEPPTTEPPTTEPPTTEPPTTEPPITEPPTTEPPTPEPTAPSIETISSITSWNDELIEVTALVSIDANATATYLWQQTAGENVNLSGAETQTVTIDGQQLQQNETIELSFTVTDSNNLTANINTTVTLNDRISAALKSGDASDLLSSSKTEQFTQSLIERTEQVIIDAQEQQRQFLSTVYASDTIDYSPGKNSQMIIINDAIHGFPSAPTYELIRGNQGRILAAATEQDTVRHAAFGTNIFSKFNAGQFTDFENSFQRLLSWQVKQTLSSESAFNVATFSLTENHSNNVQTWFSTHYPNVSFSSCSDTSFSNEQISQCFSEVDLVVVASDAMLTDEQLSFGLSVASTQSIPTLYTHQHSWNSSAQTPIVLGHMNFAMQSIGGPGNYFADDKALWASASEMLEQFPAFVDEYRWVNAFKNNTLPFNFSTCADDCAQLYDDEYKPSLQTIKSRINALDTSKENIFTHDGQFLVYKSLIVLGDLFRDSINYPMDVTTLDNMLFAKAYFADHTMAYQRPISLTPQSLGNFSRTDFSHINLIDKNVSITSKKNFRSAGVYAIPGQAFTVTRNDQSAVKAWVFINTQRSGSTKEFDASSYNRPKYLQSQHIEIEAGETLTLSSAYGGPIQVKFDQNDLPVLLDFEQVGQHPYWREGDDAVKFAADLASANFDWAEIASPHFEVHSQTAKMQQTMEQYPRWSTADTMAQAMNSNLHNYPHILAGFQGPNINTVDEISNFATAHNIEMVELDIVKHMNADQATCGSGCSGNPYDAFWSFNPLGHGDIHELGHGLENKRLRFDDFDSHASTNPYSYYTKYMNYLEHGELPNCQNLPIENEFALLQQSKKEADPFAYMQSANFTAWNQGMSIMVQMYAMAQNQGALSNGWHLVPRLHIILNEFNANKGNADNWNAIKANIGFNNYTNEEADAMSQNDFLAIAMSHATKLNYLPLYQLWGLTVTDKAKQQVNDTGYPVVPEQVFVFEGDGYCYGLDLDTVEVDGEQSWPFN